MDRALPLQDLDALWLAWCEALRSGPAPACGASSPRSQARRLKAWLELSPQEAELLARMERALRDTRDGEVDRAAARADAAARGGYSDRAHLRRHTRRATGCRPGELARRIASDEGYWLYRLLGGVGPMGPRHRPMRRPPPAGCG